MTKAVRRPRTDQPENDQLTGVPESRRYRKGSPRVNLDPAQYAHVRADLVRIGLLAFCLFGALILLRLLAPMLGLLP